MRIRHGDIARLIYFVAVDLVDLFTRVTSLTNLAVWYSINGGSQGTLSTPTTVHINNGVFSLAIDNAALTTLSTGIDEAELVIEISADEMATVTRVILIYRPKITLGETLTVNGSGHVSRVTLVDTTTVLTTGVDVTKISGDSVAADNLEATFDGTGYNDPEAPSKQSQLSAIANVGAAINIAVSEDNTGGAIKGITFVGAQTNTYTASQAEDGSYHTIDHANTIDLVYGYDIGGDGIPTQINMHGYLSGNNDALNVFGYDFVAVGWVQLGSISGKNTSANDELNYPLFVNMVGTSGADLGKVYIRFQNTGQSSPSLNIDLSFVSYAIVRRSVGYALGSIWVDTVNGTAGTENYVNGTADNPVLTWADALTLSANLGIKKFNIANGSTITLSAAIPKYTLTGANWILVLAGQSIAEAHIDGAAVSGISIGEGSDFHDCVLGDCTFANGDFLECALAGDLILSGATTYYFDNCYSGVAGTATPTIDVGAAVGNTNLNMRHYSGGIEIKNIGRVGTDNMSLEGHGQLVLNSNCVGGTIAIRGHFTITDNVVGGFVVGGGVINDDARYDLTQITTAVDGEVAGIVTIVTAMQKLQRADKVIDTVGSVWVTDYKEEGTSNILMSKTMKNTAGADITSESNVLGKLEQE